MDGILQNKSNRRRDAIIDIIIIQNILFKEIISLFYTFVIIFQLLVYSRALFIDILTY